MKTKFIRHSRSVISVILTVCMLVSCMAVGLVSTDAAQVTDSEAVGATGTFVSGSTLYLDISSVLGWSDSATIGAIFYYSDNNTWCYNTDSAYAYDSKASLASFTSTTELGNNKYSVVVPAANLSHVVFVRLQSSSPTTVWNYSNKMAASSRSDDSENMVHLNNWDNDSSWSTYDVEPTTPIYSLSGNVTSNYIVGSNVENTDAHSKGWAQYNEQFAIDNPVPGTTNTYYVDITTQNTNRTINIGLAKTGNVQYAYSINGTAYDENGEDYVVPSTGITDAMNAYVYPKISGGSIVLQPDTSYRITIDQSQYLSAGVWGKITVTQTSNPKIRFAVGSGSGTVTAVDTTTSTTLASGDTVNSGDSVTFTATPSTDYAFSAWYSDSACTNQLSDSSTYTVDNVQGNQTVYAKFTSTNWPPIDLSSYQSAGSSSNCQIYVSKSNDLTNPTHYHGGQEDAYKEYELYKNGNNYWIELSQADVQKARGSAEMYYAFTDDKAFTGIPDSASVSAATNYNYAISSTRTQDDNFPGGPNQRKFAQVTTNEDFREYIENIGILYNSDSKTYTVYYYGSQTVTESVKIYAKDGVVRKDSSDSSAGNWFQFGKYANTVLSKAAGSTQELENYNANFNAYAESGKMKKGGSITLTTTMQARLKNYYIRGYCINGTVYELLKESDQPLNTSNVATATYTFTIPEDFEDSYLEITPIYFLRDDYDDNTVTFYVEDYDIAVQNSGWGNTLFADFFYKKGTSTKHLEGYPGQPLVFYGGRYFMQVATKTKATDGTTDLGEISGVTLNNGFWDYIHSSVVKEVSANRQTYDYSNFHKIYVEKSDDKLDAIVFSYKYRTKKDNYGYSVSYSNISINDYASGSGNGWDVLKDYYGEQIDLFGNVLTETQLANDPVYVVSNGYVRTYEGQYATEWVVYDKNGNKLGVIPSSALLIDTAAHWADSTYSNECSDRTLASYQSVYNTLHNASTALNRPVNISYEKDNYASKGMNTSGQAAGDDNPGNRLDGLWYYSRKNAMVSANIKIEYSNDYYSAADPTWTVDSFTSGTATGSVTGTSAYFTNTEPNYAGNSYYGKTETGEVLSDSSKHYTFEAATSGTWMLEGWYLKSQSGIYTRITYPNDLDGESAMDANATFVARFVQMPTGTLKISHKVETNSTYPGTGTAYLSLYIFNTQADAESYMANPATSGVTPFSIQENVTSDIVIPARYLTFTDTTTQYAVVKLTTTPNADSQFVHFTGGNSEVSSTEISNDSGTAVGDGNRSYTTTISFAMQDILEHSGAYYLPKISSIDYISHLNVLNKSFTIQKKMATDSATETGDFTIRVETSTDGSNWTALANAAFTTNTTRGTGTLDGNGVTTIKADEILTFTNLVNVNTYIRVAEAKAMPLDNRYVSIAATVGGSTASVTEYDDTAWKGGYFQLTDAANVIITNNKVHRRTITITKTTTAAHDDDAKFRIRIETSTDGTTWTDYRADIPSTLGNQSPRVSATNVSEGVYEYLIQKNQVFALSLPEGTRVRVTENVGDKTGADYDVNNYYNYNSTVVNETNDTADKGTAYTSTDSKYKGSAYTVAAKDAQFTIKNDPIMQTVTVVKETDFYEDGSTFELAIKIKPKYTSNTDYIVDNDGLVKVLALDSGWTAPSTKPTDGKYHVKKTGSIKFFVPKGSRLQVTETDTFGYSQITGKQRFTFDKMVLDTDDTTTPSEDQNNGRNFVVTENRTLTVYNKVMKNNVTIQKLFVDSVGENTSEHKIKIVAMKNGSAGDYYGTEYAKGTSNDDRIKYTTSLDPTTVQYLTGTSAGDVITIHGNEAITLQSLYVGSYITVQEIEVGDGYKFDRIDVTGYADDADTAQFPNGVPSGVSIPAKTYDATNKTVSFQTHDVPAQVKVVNEKLPLYDIKYKYEGYSATTYQNTTDKDADHRVVGAERFFVQSGYITETELNDWFNVTGSGGDKTISFKTEETKKSFISAHAPYEDDFMMDLKWDGKTVSTPVYTPDTKTLSLETTATSAPNRTVNVYFKLPYDVDNETLEPSSDAPAKKDAVQYAKTTQYGNWVTTNKEYKDEKAADFVTAPLTLANGQHFQYWQITSATNNTKRDTAVKSKRCYYDQFNMTMYQDCYVEPVYAATPTDFDPSARSLADTENGEAIISFIENSRNQWNEQGGGTGMTDDKLQAGDRIYSDFLLTFGYQDRLLNKENGGVDEAGFVLEQVRELDTSDGKYVTQKAGDYATENTTPLDTLKENVKTYIAGQTVDGFVNKSIINLNSLDNKNQTKYSFSIKNKAYGNLAEGNAKNFVYRAYSYLKVGDNIVVSDPVYFTIYDMASIELGQTDAQGGQS